MEDEAQCWDSVLKQYINLPREASVTAAWVRQEEKGQNLVLSRKKSQVLAYGKISAVASTNCLR